MTWACFSKYDGLSDRATDHPPMLFVHCRMVRRPVGHSVVLIETVENTDRSGQGGLGAVHIICKRQSCKSVTCGHPNKIHVFVQLRALALFLVIHARTHSSRLQTQLNGLKHQIILQVTEKGEREREESERDGA